MNPQGAEWLAQLRDIHSAPAVPWWPPAPGWWILAVMALAGLALAALRALRAWRRQRRKRLLEGWLEAVRQQSDPLRSPQDFIAGINRVLKLVAIRAFPGQGCRRMQGRAWVEFLQSRLDGFPGKDALGVLASGPYQPWPELDAAAVLLAAREWVRRHG